MFNQNGQQLIPIGGIAWAGSRGISKVEISVDDGDWVEAELRDPLSSGETWVIWRYNWAFAYGSHTFAVRCYDGNGDLQITDNNPPHPSGATGIDSVTATVTAKINPTPAVQTSVCLALPLPEFREGSVLSSFRSLMLRSDDFSIIRRLQAM